MNGERIILAAHRGDRARYPENTMPAFISAIMERADMIETDIRETRDGVLVLIHDRSTLRTSGVDKKVDELTLAELKEINVGATFPGGAFCSVPTVEELMEAIKDGDMLVNWEFKIYPNVFGEDVAFRVVDKLVALIEKYGLEKRSMLNSFSNKTLEYIKKTYGNRFPIHGQGIYNCNRAKDEADTPEEEIFDWCCLYPNEKGTDKIATDFKENFDYCAEHGIIPCICTKDEYESYKTAIEYGCRMFTSNDIYKADEILKKLGVR